MALVVVKRVVKNPELDAFRRLHGIPVIHDVRGQACQWCGLTDLGSIGFKNKEYTGFSDQYEFGPDGVGVLKRTGDPRIKCSAIYGMVRM